MTSRVETDLNERVALVTGASSGIGTAIARTLTEAGAQVVCTGRRLDKLEELANELGDRACAVALDVDDAESVETLTARIPAQFQAIDILINNAGQDVGGRRLFHEGDAEQWAHIIQTNVTGLIRVTLRLIDQLLHAYRAHVVNIGSTAGLSGYATGTIYSASKHAVHGFSESLRLDYKDTNLRVTEIMPGMVRTGFAEARLDDATRAKKFYDDFGTCLNAEDIAQTVLFALRQPEHVVISQLVVVPRGQD